MKQKQIAADNTFGCFIPGHDHYLCYICEKCLNYKNANIDHIKPISCFSFLEKNQYTYKEHGASFNPGLGVVKNDWYYFFSDDSGEDYWYYNNIVLTHKKCNEEKAELDFTNVYINKIREYR